MFKILIPMLGTVSQASKPVTTLKRSALLSTMLAATMTLSACQQQTTPSASDSPKEKTTEQQRVEDDKTAVLSDSAAARIEQFQPLYVEQMQGLQRRLQAEFEALQAADMSDSDGSLLSDSPTDSPTDRPTDISTENQAANSTINEVTADNQPATLDEGQINTSTEVGERDLEVLKRVTLESREPIIITDAQMIENYQQALDALYQSASTLLNAEEVDTLLNIASLIPQLFEHPEIADRVNVKSPALARFIIQHQVGQQIEAQQVLDMQQMKVTQQQEFEKLIAKFDKTIKGYDEQIAKYKQTLKEFQ